MRPQRKIFRVEEMLTAKPDADQTSDVETAAMHSEILAEVRALRSVIEAVSAGKSTPSDAQAQEIRKLKIELDVIGDAIRQTRAEVISMQDQGFDSSRVARAARELEAVFEATSESTDRILKAAEEIDDFATALAALTRSEHERALAQNIQDRATAIFEACNFHDLTGQRISKVAAMLTTVEDHVARMLEIWSVIDRFNIEDVQSAAQNLDGLLNGPKLDGDNGHSTQDDIDKLFH